MDPISNSLLLASGSSAPALPNIGDFYEGGYAAGFYSLNANNIATHVIVISPLPAGDNSATGLFWKTSATSSSGTQSLLDGLSNSNAMNNASHPAAQYCRSLSINGKTDWYLPSLYELELLYYNLKPGTASNLGQTDNPYAVPQRTSGAPAPTQTSVAIFRTGGAQAMQEGGTWSSTEFDATQARTIDIYRGSRQIGTKNTFDVGYYIRAIRRVPI